MTTKLPLLATPVFALALGCSSGSARSEATSTSELVTSPDLVISQLYGGGSNSGALYTHDFVELFNRGTQPVSLNGKSLQYAGPGLAFSASQAVVALPNATVQPGKYFLVALNTSSPAVGAALPTPDFAPTGSGALALAKDNGKVALVQSNALLDGCGTTTTPCADGGWIDLVGYGSAVQAESAPIGALSNTTAALRKGTGCQDTGSNAADFTIGTPAPRNGASPAATCAATPPVDAGGAASLVLLNEVKINPPGSTDAPWEYAELLCTPGASLDGYYFAAIEGDGDSSTGSPGVADIVVSLAGKTCGANGLVLIKAAAGGHAAASTQTTVVTTPALDTGTSPFENATTSFVVIESPTAITAGSDYDIENDGVIELPAGASIVDGVSVFEQSDGAVDHTYAPRLVQSSGTADAASRVPGNTMPLSAQAWFFGDLDGSTPESLDYDASKASPNLPTGAKLTPGAANGAPVAPVEDGGSSSTSSSGSGGEEPAGNEDTTSASSSSGGKKASSSGAPASTALPPRTSSCASVPMPSTSAPYAIVATLGIALAMVRRRARQ